MKSPTTPTRIVQLLLLTLILAAPAAAEITNITITAPTGGEYWSGTQDITWTEVGDTDTIDIAYSTDDFDTQTAITTGVANGTLTHSWDTTGLTDGTYRVIVFVTGNQSINDTSAEFTVDNTAPTYSVAYSSGTSPVKQDDAITITVTFNEDMSDSVTPQIALNVQSGDPAAITATDLTRISPTEYTYAWTVGSGDGDLIPQVTVGEDLAGNVVTDTGSTRTTVEVDNTAPTVSSVAASPSVVSESDVGVDAFTVTAVFDEDMNQSVPAAVTFNPSVATTLTSCTGEWTSATTWVETCDVADADVQLADVDVVVNDAQDLAGNVMLEDAVTGADEFGIDTIAPTVVSATTADINGNGQIDRIVVVYSEAVTDAGYNALAVAGYVINASESTGSGAATLTYVLMESGSPDTGVTPALTWTGANAVDGAGNELDASGAPANAADGAAPVLVSATAVDDTTIELVFSETIAGGLVVFGAPDQWTATGLTASDANIVGANVHLTVSSLGDTAYTASDFAFATATASIEDAAGNAVVAFSGEDILDGQAPTLTSVSIESDNLNTTHARVGDNVTLTFTASETIETPVVTIDGTAADSVTNTGGNTWTAVRQMQVGDTEGVVSFTIDFDDTAGNAGTQVTATDDSSAVTFDETAPVVTISTSDFNTSNSQPTIEFTVTDNLADPLTCRLFVSNTEHAYDDSVAEGTPATLSPDVSIIDGAYSWTVHCEDDAGNAGNDTIAGTVDTTAPVVTMESSSFETSNATPSVDITVTDNLFDPVSCELFFGATGYGVTIVANDTSTELTANDTVSDGDYSVTVECTDGAENSNTSTAITVSVDTTAPVVVVNGPDESLNYSTATVTLNATVTDAGVGVDSVVFQVANGTPFDLVATNTGDEWTASLDLSTVDEGSLVITVVANDTLGNENAAETITLNVDQTDPTITVTLPVTSTPYGVFTYDVSFDGTGSSIDTSTISVELLIGASVEYSYSHAELNCTTALNVVECDGSFSVVTGSYNVTFTANDTAGNTNTETVENVTIDTSVPVADYSGSGSMSAGAYAQDWIFVNVSASTPVGGAEVDTITVYLYLDGTLEDTQSGTGDSFWRNFTSLDEGVYTVNGTVNDTLGNEGVLPNRVFTLDETAPVVTITDSDFNTTDSQPTINFTVTDNLADPLTCRLFVSDTEYAYDDGVAQGSATLAPNSVIGDGAYLWTVRCEDDAGNAANDTIAGTIDTNPPTITLVNPTSTLATSASSLVLNTTVDDAWLDVDTVEYRILNSSDSDEIVGWTAMTEDGSSYDATIDLSALNESSYTVEIRANDTLNNTATETVTVVVDRTAPVIESFTCANVRRNNDADCSYTVSDNSESWGGTLTVSLDADTSTTGTKTATLTVTDAAGNQAVNTTEFTVTLPPSSSGGGGGAGPAVPPALSANILYAQGQAGQALELAVSRIELAITRVEVVLSDARSNVRLEVREIEQPSTPFPLFRAMEIRAQNVQGAIGEANVEFAVPVSWLANHSRTALDIRLYRLVDGDWQELETEYLGTSPNGYRYRATTPGFSTFAVGLSEAAEPEPAPPAPEPAPEPEPAPPTPEPAPEEPPAQTPEPEESQGPSIILILGIIFGVLLIGAAIWLVIPTKDD